MRLLAQVSEICLRGSSLIIKILTKMINKHTSIIIRITAVCAAVVFVSGCSTNLNKVTSGSDNIVQSTGAGDSAKDRLEEETKEDYVIPLHEVDQDKSAEIKDAEDIADGEAPNDTDGAEQIGHTHENKPESTGNVETDTSEPPIVNNTVNNKDKTGDEDKEGISLVMAGDILLHIPVDRNCMLEDGSYDYSHIFDNTRDDIKEADIALVNQEVIIGGKELGVTGYPSFNAPYEIGDALVDAGFDVVCHATNHALDRNRKGIVNCLDYWASEHPEMAVIGIYCSREDRDDIYVYEQDGIKIAILNYTYGTNGVKMPDDMPYAVNLLKKDVVEKDLKRAEEIADFTIVCPHWGTEYNLGISTEQDNWTQVFLKNGADLVLGTHPHVIEPIEWIEDDEGNKMLVYYSIGNYVNWTSGSGPGTANRMIGGLVSVNIGRDASGEVAIKDYHVEAIVCHLSKEKGGITVYRLTDYDEKLARSNEIVNQDPDFSKQYCIDLCDKVWGDKWK